MSQVVRRSGQLLLLVVLALGVVGMHTLGHPSGEHCTDAMAGHHQAVAATAEEVVAAGGFIATPPRMPLTDPMNVCLAVLTAMGLAGALVALLTLRRRVTDTSVAGGGAWTIRGRGPPLRGAPLGRRLAALSVLRM